MVGGKRDVMARLLAKGSQGPDLGEGLAGTSGRMGFRPSHLRVASMRAPEDRKLRSLGIRNANLRATRSNREVFVGFPLHGIHRGSGVFGDYGRRRTG